MPLKSKVTRLEDVEESDRKHYVKTDEGYRLDLDGEEESNTLKRALDAERKQRAETTKRLQAMEERYKGVDPEKFHEAQSRLSELEEERMKAEGKQAEIAERKYMKAREQLEAEKSDLQKRLDLESAERVRISQDRARLIVRQELEKTLLSMGANPKGLSHAVSLHLDKWSLSEDNETPVRKDGDRILVGTDPNRPLSMKEDLQDWLKKDEFAEHFFLPSSGGGANGNMPRLSGGSVVISREDARDHQKFMAAQKQAEKAGVPLVQA